MNKTFYALIGLLIAAVVIVGVIVVNQDNQSSNNVPKKVGALTSPDLSSGFLTLGGGAGIIGVWQPLNQATTTQCSPASGDSGMMATSTLVDSIVTLTATDTQAAIISWYKVTSAYGYGIATTGAATEVELASTTVDLSEFGGTFSLANASSSILNDPDGSNFDLAAREAFVNIWNPRTDHLLVNINAKNVQSGETTDGFNLTGSCATYFRGSN